MRLGTLLSIVSDGTHKTPNYVEKGVPFLSVQNISKGFFDLSKLKYITEDEHRKLCERVAPQKNDILICRIGTLGKAIKCTLDIEFSIFVSLGLLRLVDAQIVDYIVFAINSPLGDRWIQENKVGGGTHTYKINLSDLPNMLIPLPPKEEQTRIFHKMQEIEPLLSEYNATDCQLTELSTSFPDMLKKSILQWAVQGKLVPQDENDEPAEELLNRIRAEKEALIKAGKIKRDKHESVIFRRDNSHYEKCGREEVCIDDEIPFEIPKTWAWVRIKDIFNTSSGTTPMRSVSSYYSSPDYNWVRTTDLNNSTLRSCEIKISKKAFEECRLEVIPRNSVCIAMYGGAGTIGKNALIDFDTTINQSVCAIHPNYYCNMKYIQLFIQYYRPFWMDRATGTRKDPNINQVIIKNTLIPIPPVSEQLKIVELVETIFKKISSL